MTATGSRRALRALVRETFDAATWAERYAEIDAEK